jgi:hypothetical protein
VKLFECRVKLFEWLAMVVSIGGKGLRGYTRSKVDRLGGVAGFAW